MSKVRTVFVVLPLLISVLALAPAASAYEPPEGAVFNNPKGNTAAKWRIVRTVNESIRAARKGSRIQISTFLMDSRSSVDALLGARKRGVQVQMVIDGSAKNGTTRRLATVFNRDNGKRVKGKRLKWGPDGSYVRFCNLSCRGIGAPNHTKYYTFTRTGTASNVIMVSSSNLNKGGATKGFNDLVVLKERKALIANFATVHAEMTEDTSNDKDGFLEFTQGNATARFYPKPKGPDPVITDLNQVKCKGAGGGAGRAGRTAINVSMFRWNNERGFAIARKLVRLDDEGCDVQVMYGAPGNKVADILKASARRGGIKLWDTRWDFNDDQAVDLRVHHKYTLINGVYGKDTSSWRVHTGSANWGQDLRAGDENTLTVVSRPLYNQYLADWNRIRVAWGRQILPAAWQRMRADRL